MFDKLDFLVRFWELKARNASLGEPLAAREQVELLSLLQLVTADLETPPVGPTPRPNGALPAQIIGGGAILAVEIRNVTAAAIVVSAAAEVKAGTHVVLRAADAISGIEYTLPCKVLWVHPAEALRAANDAGPLADREATFLALAVDGIPARAVFGEVPMPRATVPFALGRHERLVG